MLNLRFSLSYIPTLSSFKRFCFTYYISIYHQVKGYVSHNSTFDCYGANFTLLLRGWIILKIAPSSKLLLLLLEHIDIQFFISTFESCSILTIYRLLTLLYIPWQEGKQMKYIFIAGCLRDKTPLANRTPAIHYYERFTPPHRNKQPIQFLETNCIHFKTFPN